MDTLIELKEIAGQNSHPEFPLLRVGYSPSSRYPATDFTPWIKRQLEQKDYDSLGLLLTQLTAGNSGGLGSKYWKGLASNIAKADLHNSIYSTDLGIYRDLQSALFLFVLHGVINGNMLIDQHVEYLVRVVSPYIFSIPDLDIKVKAANSFIRKRRKELKQFPTLWTDFHLLKAERIECLLQRDPPSSDLLSIMQKLSISSRLMFLGTIEEGAGQGAWKVRPFGIDENQATKELVNARLGCTTHNQEIVLSTYKNEELLSALSGFPTKHGWKKKYIINFMLENAQDIASKLTEGKEVFVANAEYTSSVKRLINWTKQINIPLAIALAFN